jgi:hypothetical protein
MLDKLTFTIDKMPDKDYISHHGDIREYNRDKLYKYIGMLNDITIFYLPHKFDSVTNFRIPASKIDINPKNFENFTSMLVCASSIITDIYHCPEMCNITRIDAAADIEDLSIKTLLAMLHVQRITLDTFRIIKGTIYAGSDPKFRIYDKIKELKYKIGKGYKPTEYEKALIGSRKEVVRFEVQKRANKMTLKGLPEKAVNVISYFDRMDFFNLNENEFPAIMHNLYRLIPRKYRKELERYKESSLINKIKERCKAGIQEWFIDKEPF